MNVAVTLALLAAVFAQPPAAEPTPLPDVLAKVLPGVRFDDVPLRRAVSRLAETNGAALAFVRGLDPTTPVTLDAENLTVAEALADAAGQGNAAAVALGGAVYVASPETCAAALAIAAARRTELEPTRGVRRAPRERALEERDVRWDDLTTPRALLEDVAAQASLTITNPDAVPHDLWPAGRLPAADIPTTLAAVLAPFDLTFVWSEDRTGVTIEPLPEGFAAEPAPPLTSFAAKTAVGEGGGVPLDRRTFTLKVQGASVQRVMEAVAGVRFEYDPRALAAGGGDLDARVSIDVTEADADTFFTALFAPAGIAFSWEGTTVTLHPTVP
ncbi:hypothetical protein [Alienimonas californiensis]|uniref:Secretin/TonB short N-terminal domain-containing protein n=1 Tax=Alienimonas californiensis TaxID=2527989 RepID=A0A517PF33_9PLAN|nr:hypothetical protein [Alienimonas californiensis]QDT17987.1 hypothetical protein CA12_41250 [Alienimonas californiensis]